MNLLDVISIILTVSLTIVAFFFLFGIVTNNEEINWLEQLTSLVTTKLKR
ncbi:MAG: hypothetical protein KC422_14960 [Trueperaceae bacterium]|nr:hypothetical protein [Trueperaceae bacterium]